MRSPGGRADDRPVHEDELENCRNDIALGGYTVAAIIAAGCGYPGDEIAEDVASRLTIEAQVDLLSATLRLTLPGGFGPFVEKLTALGGLILPAAQADAGDGPSATAPASS